MSETLLAAGMVFKSPSDAERDQILALLLQHLQLQAVRTEITYGTEVRLEKEE